MGGPGPVVPGCERRDARAVGHDQAIVRAEVADGWAPAAVRGRDPGPGRNRVLCNRQPVARSRDLHGLLRVTVFAPDDLTLVKGGPSRTARIPRRAPGDARGALRRGPLRFRTCA